MSTARRTILLAAMLLASASIGPAETTPAPATQPVAAAQPDNASTRLKHHQDYIEAFSAPSTTATAEPEESLQAQIQRLNAMSGSLDHVRRVKKQAQPEPLIPASQPTSQPAQAASRSETLDTSTMNRLRSTLPKNVADPIRLADSLQVTGHADEAFDFYRACLASTKEDHRKSWLLYQMAQCRMSKDPAESIEYLRRVIGEFPDSQWAQLARVQLQLLKWTRDDQPRAYLAELDTFLLELKKAQPLVQPIENTQDKPAEPAATETARADTSANPS